MACSVMNPSLMKLVNSGLTVSGPGFFRDWGLGGILPREKVIAEMHVELAEKIGLLQDDENTAFWEQIDEIELSLGETALSLQEKIQAEDAFLEEMDRWVTEHEEEPLLDTSSPGYKMMKAMGWEDNTPLGKCGEGILKPVSSSVKFREPGDLSGLGYEKKENKIVEGEEDKKEVKIIRKEQNFAVGDCSRGKVYIPRGPMRHLMNLIEGNIIGRTFHAKIMAKNGRYEWRVTSVIDLA